MKKVGASLLVLGVFACAAPAGALTMYYAPYQSSYGAYYGSSGLDAGYYRQYMPMYPQYSQPSYLQQPYYYGYGSSYGYSTPSPYNYRYPVGDTDAFGYDLCYWEGYGRSRCDFNPRQPVYDYYTGTWY